jgi:hypothetical protein
MGRVVQLPSTALVGLFIVGSTLPFLTWAVRNQPLLSIEDPPGAASDELIHRSQFPKDFIFGSGTSAYQVPPTDPLPMLSYRNHLYMEAVSC